MVNVQLCWRLSSLRCKRCRPAFSGKSVGAALFGTVFRLSTQFERQLSAVGSEIQLGAWHLLVSPSITFPEIISYSFF